MSAKSPMPNLTGMGIVALLGKMRKLAHSVVTRLMVNPSFVHLHIAFLRLNFVRSL